MRPTSRLQGRRVFVAPPGKEALGDGAVAEHLRALTATATAGSQGLELAAAGQDGLELQVLEAAARGAPEGEGAQAAEARQGEGQHQGLVRASGGVEAQQREPWALRAHGAQGGLR